MIRINLIPSVRRSAGAQSASQAWVVLYAVGGFATCVALFFYYMGADGEVEEQRAKNRALSEQIERSKAQAGDVTEVEAALQKSRQLEQIAQSLQSARQGPTRLLMELSHILTPGRGPSVDAEALEKLRRENPLAGYNPSWDVHRLWLTSFREESRECKLTGIGRTNEDVAEFLRRLTLSEIFDKVELQNTTSERDSNTELSTVAFEVGCKVKY